MEARDLAFLARERLLQYPDNGVDNWVYFLDQEGNEIARVKGLDFGVSLLRNLFRLAGKVRDVAYVGLIHGRSTDRMPVRSSWLKVETQDTVGYTRKRQSLEEAEVTNKDTRIFESVQLNRGKA